MRPRVGDDVEPLAHLRRPAAAGRVGSPCLFVHSDGCVFPDHVKQVHASVKGPTEMIWTTGNQIDFYDQPQQVNAAVEAIDAWFKRTL